MEAARGCLRHLRTLFQELEECRAFELLKVRHSDWLLPAAKCRIALSARSSCCQMLCSTQYRANQYMHTCNGTC